MISEMFGSKRRQKLAMKVGLMSDTPGRNDAHGEDTSFTLLPEDLFQRMLSIERKRMERSRQRSVLMLVDVGKVLQAEGGKIILEGIAKALSASTRETDLQGWYNRGSMIGVVWTETGTEDLNSILGILHSKVGVAFRTMLEPEQMKVIQWSFHVFPDDLELKNGGRSTDITLHSTLLPAGSNNASGHAIPGLSTLIAS